MQVEKTVFISYRRTNQYHARAVYQHLSARGYDCFLDYERIDSGSFERIILNQIAARAHFILILTPSALERCAAPNDWLRREIERAIELRRNIVPLLFDQFSFDDARQYLTGPLAQLEGYNGLEVPPAYFEEAMERLQTRFLNKPLDLILHPTPTEDEAHVARTKQAAAEAPVVTNEQLRAEEEFERGVAQFEQGNVSTAIEHFTRAIALRGDFAEAYFRRSAAHRLKFDPMQALRDMEQAVALADADNPRLRFYRGGMHLLRQQYDAAVHELSEAIRAAPSDPEAYRLRGSIYGEMGDYARAVADFDEALRLNPQDYIARHGRGYTLSMQGRFRDAEADYEAALVANPKYVPAYFNRGMVRANQGLLADALADFDEAIRLNPEYAPSFIQRGMLHAGQKDFEAAITDFDEAIRLNPQDPWARNNRGFTREQMGDLDGAIADYEGALRIMPMLDLAQNNLRRARLKKMGGGLLNLLRGR